jgi:FkbM family methyltransferase
MLKKRILYLICKCVQGKIAMDSEMGPIIFPQNDNVMLPILAQNGIWEPNEFKWLKENVNPGDFCLNVGANVGYFSLLMSSLVGKSGGVIAIEPNKKLRTFFVINQFIHKKTNIRFISAAAGQSLGKIHFYSNTLNFGDSRVYDPRIVSSRSSEILGFNFDKSPGIVKLVTINSIKPQARKIDVILIDAQGFDIEVLLGGKERIIRDRPKVLFEFLPAWLESRNLKAVDCLRMFEEWGFRLSSPDLGPDEYSAEDIVRKMLTEDLYFINVELIPDSILR